MKPNIYPLTTEGRIAIEEQELEARNDRDKKDFTGVEDKVAEVLKACTGGADDLIANLQKMGWTHTKGK